MKKLIYFIKYNKVAYFLYYHFFGFIVNILKLFVKPDNRLILINSYAGRNYDDSPKAIFDVIKGDKRFNEYKIVWAFNHPDDFVVDGATKISTTQIKYFITALRARVWITNSSVEHGLCFSGKNTIYINTWHGTPIKKMGSDIPKGNLSFSSKGKSRIDAMNAQGDFEVGIFSKAFGIPEGKFLRVGLPRNDELSSYTAERWNDIRQKLGLPVDKKVILYCPTFREYDKDENYGVVFAPPMDLKKWEKELKSSYVLLVRAHYEVSNVMDIKDNEFIRNVTYYPHLIDLMICSDILISDYSSIYFDYSIMDKPMLQFTYDYDKYQKKRGMYFDIREYLSGADTEDNLIRIINDLDYNCEVEKTKIFRNKFVNYYGNAAKATVDYIANKITR